MTLVEMARYFAEHAASDLRQAQAMATFDQSGHVLATAMYLAQQSTEKQLKSIIINMDEKMGLDNSESIARLLGHQLYSGLHKFYDRQIAGLDIPPMKNSYIQYNSQHAKNVVLLKDFFGKMGKFWTSHSTNPRLQSLFWLQSLGIRLKDADVLLLHSTHTQYVDSMLDLATTTDTKVPPMPKNDYVRRPMLDAIMDDALLASYRGRYARAELNTIDRHRLGTTFEQFRAFLLLFPNPVPAPFHADGAVAKNIAFTFGILILLLEQYQYLILLANNSYGRYPKRLEDGRITTDVYASQADTVMHCLLVDVPYRLGQLRANSGRLDVLLDMGRERGCW